MPFFKPLALLHLIRHWGWKARCSTGKALTRAATNCAEPWEQDLRFLTIVFRSTLWLVQNIRKICQWNQLSFRSSDLLLEHIPYWKLWVCGSRFTAQTSPRNWMIGWWIKSKVLDGFFKSRTDKPKEFWIKLWQSNLHLRLTWLAQADKPV